MYLIGRLVGHSIASIEGLYEAYNGGQMFVGGLLATPETGPVGARVTVVGGAMAVHGVGTMGQAAVGIEKDWQLLQMSMASHDDYDEEDDYLTPGQRNRMRPKNQQPSKKPGTLGKFLSADGQARENGIVNDVMNGVLS